MSEFILIIGVTGYIGFKTLLTALESGYKVRAVVRKESQIPTLKTNPKLTPYTSSLSFVVVPDMAIPGAFDSALKDITAVIQLASPLAIETDDYERDIITPAISINSSLLNTAKSHPKIRRIIITSSAVTLIPFQWLSSPTSQTYTSASLNTNPSRPFSSAMEAYWASKALSRIAVHEFFEQNKDEGLGFDYVQLLPSVVIGPDPRATTTEELLEGTRAIVMGPILGTTSPYPMVGVPVNVSDVARAHIDAIKSSVPGNKDYILSSDTPEGVQWDEGMEIARKYFGAECGEGGVLPLGGGLGTTRFLLDVGETEKAFGWEFVGFEETMRGLIGQFVELKKKAL